MLNATVSGPDGVTPDYAPQVHNATQFVLQEQSRNTQTELEERDSRGEERGENPAEEAGRGTYSISKSRRARKAPSSMQLMWLLSSCLQMRDRSQRQVCRRAGGG